MSTGGVRKCILVCMILLSGICYKSYRPTGVQRMTVSLNGFYQNSFSSRSASNEKYKHSDRKSTHPPFVIRHVYPTGPESPPSLVTYGRDLPAYNDNYNIDTTTLLTSQITSPRKSKYEIIDLKNKYVTCDKIHVFIQARDDWNRPKQNGGDYFRARIYNDNLNASSSNNGDIIDHGNGTYSAYFTLPWTGLVNIEVTLMIPSEVIRIVKRIYHENPYRMVYEGKFQSGKKIKITKCHIHLDSSRLLCNFTDELSGQPWFCEKPKNLPCSSWIEHHGNPALTQKRTNELLLPGEEDAFQTKYIRRVLRRLQPLAIKVQSNEQLEGYHLCKAHLPFCRPRPSARNPGLSSAGGSRPTSSMTSGFYYRDVWHSNVCNARYLSTAAVQSCLRNKRLYFYGDSTLRQWYNFLLEYLPTLNNVTFYEHKSTYKVGPLTAEDPKNNFTSRFFHHGLPIRNTWMLVKNIQYEFNEIDKLRADKNTVVVLNMWAHFTGVTLDDYQSRLICVRNALTRLYQRSPETLVIIKSANTRSFAYTPTSTINFSDWYVMKLDAIMRDVMKDVPNIVIIDVWDMTNCHHTGSDVHPHDLVVREEIKMMLSYVCSSKRNGST
ncbi:NXPE family member 3-like [Antedon mediterranea]|uniref:NXPE family member 3-like n=1 Tax=Antedon mediterranea TaxID=105859 RepID=UPI003AF7E8B5